MDTGQLRFTDNRPRYDYLISFGRMLSPIRLPEGLMIRYSSPKPLVEGDIIKRRFKAPIELKPLVEQLRHQHPEIFRAKRFKVADRLGEHLAFLVPLSP